MHVGGPEGGTRVRIALQATETLQRVLDAACSALGIKRTTDMGLAHGRSVLRSLATTTLRASGLPPGARLDIVAANRKYVGTSVSVALVDAATGRRAAAVCVPRSLPLGAVLLKSGFLLSTTDGNEVARTPVVQVAGAGLPVRGISSICETPLCDVVGDCSSSVLRVSMVPEAVSATLLEDLYGRMSAALEALSGSSRLDSSGNVSVVSNGNSNRTSDPPLQHTSSGNTSSTSGTVQNITELTWSESVLTAVHENTAISSSNQGTSGGQVVQSQSVDCNSTPETIAQSVPFRNVHVHAISARTRPEPVLDSEDYEPTAAHIAAAHADAVARTRALADAPLVSREAAARRRREEMLARHPSVRLRLRLPRPMSSGNGGAKSADKPSAFDEIAIDATFQSIETGKDVHEFVAEHVMRNSGVSFALRTAPPSRPIPADSSAIVDLGLVPSAVVFVDCATPVDLSHLTAPRVDDPIHQSGSATTTSSAEMHTHAPAKPKASEFSRPSWLRI